MLFVATVKLVNSLLASEDWARERLKSFAGQTTRLQIGTLSLPLEIASDGFLACGDKNVDATVTITLPVDAPIRAITDRPSLLAEIRVSGSAELAESLGFIFRRLSWDAEGDLSRLVGDIVAHRVFAGGRLVVDWHQEQARKLALNLADYFTEESPAIARHRDISAFCSAIDSLQKALVSVEKRVTTLER